MFMHQDLISPSFKDYHLIDSAGGRKCELIAGYRVERHSPQAIWSIKKHPKDWTAPDATCIRKKDGGGEWKFHKKPQDKMICHWESQEGVAFKFLIKFTSFGHCGLFFEQCKIWNLIESHIGKQKQHSQRPLKFLNLFGYTGAASIITAKNGVITTHIDSSKGIINWANENAKYNAIEPSHIKLIHEDAMTYIKNAIKRNLTFDGILADPPSWGNGVNKEVWNFDNDISSLMAGIKKILAPENSFFILTSHTQNVQAQALKNIMSEHLPHFNIQFGDLGIKHEQDDRILPAGVYASASNIKP